MVIGKKIRTLRKQKGLKANYITKALGKSPSWLSLIESGRNNLATEYLMPISELLGVTVEELLSDRNVFESKINDEQAASSA